MTNPTIPRQRSFPTVRKVLIIVFLFGYYLNHTLFLSDSLFIPAYMAALSGGLLFVMNVSALSKSVVSFGVWLNAVVVASIIANPSFWMEWATEFSDRYFKSFLVFVLVFVASMGAYAEITRTPARWMRAVLELLVVFILVGCFLEVSSQSFRALFEAVSSPFIRSGFAYDNAVRDIQFYGAARPKFLTSEPSNVSIFLVFAFVSIFLIGEHCGRRLVRFSVMFLAALWIVRGPTLVLVPVMCFLFSGLKHKMTIFAFGLGGLVVGLILLPALPLPEIVSSRLDWVLGGNDRSFFVRQVLPFQVALETISNYPLFGIGFGGKDAAGPIAFDLFWQSAKRADWFFEAQEPLGGNGFWIIWTQLGLIGAPLFILLIARFARRETSLWLPVLCAIAVFFANGGAPNTMRVWGFTFVLIGLCHVLRPQERWHRVISTRFNPINVRRPNMPSRAV